MTEARIYGMTWGNEVSRSATAAGRLDTLQLMHKNRCLDKSRIADAAAEHKHLHVLQWVDTLSPPFTTKELYELGDEWAAYNDIEALEWLFAVMQKRGIPGPSTLEVREHTAALAWML